MCWTKQTTMPGVSINLNILQSLLSSFFSHEAVRQSELMAPPVGIETVSV